MVDLSRRHLLALTGSTTLGSLTTIPSRTTAKSEVSITRRFRAHDEPNPTPPVVDAHITITYHDPHSNTTVSKSRHTDPTGELEVTVPATTEVNMTFHKSTPTGPYATRLDTVPHTHTLPTLATGTTDDTDTYYLPLIH